MRRAVLTAALALVLSGCEVVETVEPSGERTKKPTRPPAKSGEISIVVDVVTEGGGTVVLVPVKINGHGPYQFILDTGASISAVDKRLVRRLSLTETGDTAEITGVTGRAVLPLVGVPAWTLSGVKLHADALPAIDLKGSGSGLLGADELRRFGAVRIDFTSERLILRDR